MVKKLQEYEKCFSCTLELWTFPDEILENTIEKEKLWAEQSHEYLKETGLLHSHIKG